MNNSLIEGLCKYKIKLFIIYFIDKGTVSNISNTSTKLILYYPITYKHTFTLCGTFFL